MRHVRCNPNRLIAHVLQLGKRKPIFEKEEWFASHLILWYILSTHYVFALASFIKKKLIYFSSLS